jgi:hypothetical protein
MALIRGLRGLCPCPKCLVPKDQLSDLTVRHEARTGKGVHELVGSDLAAGEKDELLKAQGLRDIEVSHNMSSHPIYLLLR